MLSIKKHGWRAIRLLMVLALIANLHAARAQFPDTLMMGGYQMIVQEYDPGGFLDPLSKNFVGLNGLALINFSCIPQGMPLPLHSIPITQASQPTGIGSMANSIRSIASAIGKQHIALQGMVNRTAAPSGILVRFTDLTVRPVNQAGTTGEVLEGIATYPTDSPFPSPPFTLPVEQGFQLNVFALHLTPNSGTTATATLTLPSSLSSPEGCNGAILDLGNIQLSSNCEFYHETSGPYGLFNIGNTSLGITGQGFVADFSATQSHGNLNNFWKGVVLLQGESVGSPGEQLISNLGYLQAHYSFTHARVEGSGFSASLNSVEPYHFNTTQPLGYAITVEEISIMVSSSRVDSGHITKGRMALPRTAVRQADDATVELEELNLIIRPNMDLIGMGKLPPEHAGVYWGDLIAAGGADQKSFGIENLIRDVWLFFSASPREPFQPLDTSGTQFQEPFSAMSLAALDSFGIQGATFPQFHTLVINTPDNPDKWEPNQPDTPWFKSPVHLVLAGNKQRWLNVATEGVHCHITAEMNDRFSNFFLGNPADPAYLGGKPFEITAGLSFLPWSLVLQCVESAVINCDYRSFIMVPKPMNTTLGFREMVFTSTARSVGGKLTIGDNNNLVEWGLKLVPRQGFSTAGLLNVPTGQIILTAAGLSEERHFAQPFWITWGEMLADGNAGRFFFDYNTAGQQFDGFNFAHNAVALSPIVPDRRAFLRVGGTIHFPFFGPNYLHIRDLYVPEWFGIPHNQRVIDLTTEQTGSFLPSDLSISGNWSDSLGVFNFDLTYNENVQDGFTGTGTSLLRNLVGGAINSKLDLNRRGSCIRMGSDLMDQRSISLILANISIITRIWGCICIKNDAVENMVVGGEVTHAANASVATRAGSYLSAVLQVTPSLTRLTFDGEAYLALNVFDVVANGHTQLTLNKAGGFLEGEVSGKFRTVESTTAPPVLGNALEAEGQLNWHFGSDFIELQGTAALQIMKMNAGLSGNSSTSVGGGFYVGINAPKSRAWVLLGADHRYNLNVAALPDPLKGVYGYLHFKRGVNLFVVSGDYEAYLGLGAFFSPMVGIPAATGNLFGRIHGEILGGLVSASAYFNLQLLMGLDRIGFEGTVGLEGCALWIACKSVDITIGVNSVESFYIR